MGLITKECETVAGLVRFCKAVKRPVTQEGETFWWAPVGCEEWQVGPMAELGFHQIEIAGRLGFGWTK